MFWADKFAEKIIASGRRAPYWVDDMKTPSGKVHVGALRGVAVHALIHNALVEKGKKSVNTYVINDLDPMDGFPHYLPESFKKHMGEPLYKIPSPEPGYKSMAECYGQQFIDTFNTLGFKPKILWSSQMYKAGKFDEVIKEALDKVAVIRKLYQKISGYKKPKDWYPYQVICPKCGKVGSTIVTDWDGQMVSFECKPDLVEWAEGCGHKGKIEPKGLNGKLMWKVDWAAHWKVVGVTVEGAGKDHMSKGGSHDLSSEISEKVFDYKQPFSFAYEWFLAKGGAKMSSSKGVGTSAQEISQTLPAEVLRYLLVKTPYKRAIVFDPADNDSILDLFDDYDEAAEAYFSKGLDDDLGKAWYLSQLNRENLKQSPVARFRDVVTYIQDPKINLEERFAKTDKKELEMRIKYAQIWLDKYAPEDKKVGVVGDLVEVSVSAEQKKYLQLVMPLLDKKWPKPEDLQQALYDAAKNNGLNPKASFQAIYLALTGKTFGPKAAWFLLDQEAKMVKNKLTQAIIGDTKTKEQEFIYPVISGSEYLTIAPAMAKAYPSVVLGVAIIEGITVADKHEGLEVEKEALFKDLSEMSMEDLNNSAEIGSYRRLYREMKVDWGSRKASPAALIRRSIKGQPLYTINTCVDAYNLVVMRYRVSAGAFDMDKVEFPARLDIAKGGEKALYIGDKEPTVIKAGEVCYFDRKGAYNLDFNYRDAVRTSVDKDTKNIIINVDGIYEIDRARVEKTLKEVIDTITKYCGGKVKMAAIVKGE